MRILVVDDELVSRAKLTKTMENYGSCDSASSGEEALEMVKASLDEGNPYRLVTLDIAMPGMDGMEVLSRMREIEKSHNHTSKVLMVSSHAQRDLVSECIQFGCDDYLIKPIRPEDIKKKLRIFSLTS